MPKNQSRSYRRGWRLRVGIIAPSVWDYQDEYERILPDGVNLVTLTLGATNFTEEDMKDARDRREAAAKELDDRDVDCILAAGGPVSTLEGRKAEKNFIFRMQSELDAPFTTVLQAQVEALEAVDADSVLLVTPFPANRDQETKEYLEASGIDVAAVGGISLPETYDTRSTSETQVYGSVRSLAAKTADFDAVLVGCAPFGHVEYISPLEADLDCPVIMSTQAQIWKAFKMGDISSNISGYGVLFD